jgi:hypothetical protein
MIRSPFFRWSIGPCLALLSCPASAPGQDRAPVAEICVARTDEPIRIDGVLDDAAWSSAAAIDRFQQQRPRDGEPATEATAVRMTYDADRLYLSVHAKYTDPSAMRANLGDRDGLDSDDVFAVYLDPFLDRQRAYRFAVNGYGVQADGVLSAGGDDFDDDDFEGDDTWDALFESKGRIVADGWTAELAIPFKSLRYPHRDDGEHRWGLQLVRTLQARDEQDAWAPMTRDVQGFLTQMGVLCGLRDLSTSRNLELLPTLAAVRVTTREDDTGELVQEPIDPAAGLSVKYGLASDLTLDVTVNPDFSQIEADRPQITLNQRFPIFYDERRPFFLEGQDLFATSASLVHTRTIVDPFVGIKLTGKVGRTTVGLIATDDQAAGRGERGAPRGPTAKIAVGRVRYNLQAESYLGAIVTDREHAGGFSRLAGLDGNFRLGDTKRLSVLVAGTDHRDNEGHRQRGAAADVEFRRAGRHLEYGAMHRFRSPGFRTDLGFVERTDIAETQADVSYDFWPQRTIVRWGPRVEYLRIYDHRGVLNDERIETNVSAQFARNIEVFGEHERAMERFAEIDFRTTGYRVGVDVNASRRVSAEIDVDWGDGIQYSDMPAIGRSRGAEIEVNVRPSHRLDANLSIEVSRLSDPATGDVWIRQTIYRMRAAYQFSDRWFLRTILEHDTGLARAGANLLLTYRVNAGTVAFVGYDDRFEQLGLTSSPVFGRFHRTNRAVFTKLSFLWRM